jgi:hypothetical protein
MSKWALHVGLTLLVTALSADAAWACAAAEERFEVLAADATVEGLGWPAGSTLIRRRGFVRGCTSSTGFCLSEVKLARDTNLCGVPIPKSAQVYVDYVLDDGGPQDERGVFITVIGAPDFVLDGVAMRHLVTARCDGPANEPRLRGGQLDAAHTFGAEKLHAGVWFDLAPPSHGGHLRRAWFTSKQTFRGLSLPAETMVHFAPDGTVTSFNNYSYADIAFANATCHVGFSTHARVYPSGELQECELAPPGRVGALTVCGPTTFHKSGGIATAKLCAETVLGGKRLHWGQKITLRVDGELEEVE